LKSTSLVRFIEPMECLLVSKLPQSSGWTWEIKLDGYRALAVKNGTKLTLFSRRKNSLNIKFPSIAAALPDLPAGTVLDGEVVALDDNGRPIFNLLQKFRSASSRIQYHVFDLPYLDGKDLTKYPLKKRRKLLQELQIENDRIKVVKHADVDPATVLAVAKKEKLEGIIGKRVESHYQIGQRTGDWIKLRINLGQEFVIGGYTPSPLGVDAILIGYYEKKKLIYVARVRNGFVPASRKSMFEIVKNLHGEKCSFANLPEHHRTQWGEGLTAEKMKECIWIKPKLVAQIEFLEWTTSNHLRHATFMGLRNDKVASKVFKEDPSESLD
jgi:DNA ligase D-like protein (predicted ligase)